MAPVSGNGVQIVDTDVLIIGAGPAGASAAVFLSRYGIRCLMVSKHRGTSETPRAHITNQRAMEALRDAGLERSCIALASPAESIGHTFFLRSMLGEEIARVPAWGNAPERIGDYAAASPCHMCDLPQTELEPILVSEATRLGCEVRFRTELKTFEQKDPGVTAWLRDRLTQQEFEVHAKYMIGADGARSRVVEQLGIELTGKHGLGNAINVYCEIGLGDSIQHRQASLYAVIQPGSSLWAPVAVFRMVRRWDRWLVALIVPESAANPDPSLDDIEARIRELVGHEAAPVKILHVSRWTINDIVAEHYSVGSVFCMGDAVHRHPPTNGLGSNTCIQDAFNLAWKMALVLQGKAGAKLLDSYEPERQPVGRQIVARANKSMIQNAIIWDLLGGGTRRVMTPEEHAAVFDTSQGRAQLRVELDQMRYEYHAHGVELNRQYASSAVYANGSMPRRYERDAELYYQPSTHPGCPLPHAWLGTRLPGPRVSTLDLAGKGRFSLLTGPGGEAWCEAASFVARELRQEIACYRIGPFLDYEDLYGSWMRLSEVEEAGCVLVRPDLYVAWRSAGMAVDPGKLLSEVMKSVLSLE
jgi:2,4-dichlorophenol 6-monooxygenase